MTKKLLIAIVAVLPLAGCVSYGGGGYGGGGYGGYGYAGAGAGPIGYDGYYDDYYGPIYDGYWGDGGVFYYRNSDHGRFHSDRSGHFRRDMNGGPGGGNGHGGSFNGQPGSGQSGGHGGGSHGRPGGEFHPMHGTFTPPPARGGGHHH